jgi:hypothetical protein
MSKKIKLNPGELKVTSFITSLEREQEQELKGGVAPTVKPYCTLYLTCTCPSEEYTCRESCIWTCQTICDTFCLC